MKKTIAEWMMRKILEKTTRNLVVILVLMSPARTGN
jgi:hypothetical protein